MQLRKISLADRGFLDQAEILRRFDQHVAGEENHYLEIWQWINLELWMRKCEQQRSV